MDTKTDASSELRKKPFEEESVDLFLNTAKSEYDNEHKRTSIIDSKTNISLPIISAFVLAFIQINDYKSIFELPATTFGEFFLSATLFLSYTVALILGISSLVFMVRVILTREYRVLKAQDFYNEVFLKNNAVAFSLFVGKKYCEAMAYNKSQNDLRIKWYKKSWLRSAIAIVFYLIYIVIKNNM